MVCGLALLIAASGCSSDDDSATTTAAPSTTEAGATTTSTTSASASTATTTTVATSTTVAGTTTTVGGGEPSPSGDAVPNGVSFGYVEQVDIDNATVTIDIAQLLTGDAANKAAIEDGFITGIGDDATVPNDYYVRNQNPKLRTAPVTDSVEITVLADLGSPTPEPGTLAKLAQHVIDRPEVPVHITATGGEISKIEEQFFP